MNGFSIIVCCYNSAEILPETLSYLARLVLPENTGVELLVIDNCCTDNSAAVAGAVWHAHHSPFDIRIIEEKTPGLSAARVKGIECARYDTLVFCDDDNFLGPDYLEVASRILSVNQSIGALGGYATVIRQNIPSYWPDNFFIYGNGPQADKNGKATILHGAGVIIRKEAFQALQQTNFEFILTDRKGQSLTSGGDFELCYAIHLAGYEIWYDDTLKLDHYIKSARFTKEYYKKFIRESAPALDVLEVYAYFTEKAIPLLVSFYIGRMKSFLFHFKGIFVSCQSRYRYRGDEKIRFLEDFHIRFHWNRLKLIVRNIFIYPKTYRSVKRLKQKLSQRSSLNMEMKGVFNHVTE